MTTERVNRMQELGNAGLSAPGGRIMEEFLTGLQGEQGRKVYTEMSLNDPVIAGLLFATEMPLRGASWFFQPAGDRPADREAVEFLDTVLADMSHSWADFISQVLTMLVYGWAYFEKVYKVRRGVNADPRSLYNDGRIGVRKLAFRAQTSLERWEFDDNGGIEGMVQITEQGGFKPVVIPIRKSLLFRTRTDKNNPEGRSIIRTAYRPWYMRKNLEEIEAIALERMGAGYPIIYMPQNWGTEELTAAQKIVRRVRGDQQMGITLPGKQTEQNPNGWSFEFAAPPGGSGQMTEGFDRAITRYRSEILVSVLATFIQLGTSDVGSFALSRDQRSFFQVALEGWAEVIAQTINRWLVPEIVQLNGFGVTDFPELAYTDIAHHEPGTLAQFLMQAVTAGLMTPTPETEVWLRQVVGAPELTPEERSSLEEPPPPPPPPPSPAEGPSDEEAVEQAAALAKKLEAEGAPEDQVKAAQDVVAKLRLAAETRHEELGIAYADWPKPEVRKQGGTVPVSKPFAGYADFGACMADQQSKGHSGEAARRICGALQRDAEKATNGVQPTGAQ